MSGEHQGHPYHRDTECDCHFFAGDHLRRPEESGGQRIHRRGNASGRPSKGRL